MLEAAAREQHARLDQRLDHGLVGVALFALVVDDALSGKTRRVISEGAVFVDGIGDGSVDAVFLKFARTCGPDFEVLATMPWSSMNEACSCIVGNMVTVEKLYQEVVASSRFERM